jgi:hypothetical protein
VHTYIILTWSTSFTSLNRLHFSWLPLPFSTFTSSVSSLFLPLSHYHMPPLPINAHEHRLLLLVFHIKHLTVLLPGFTVAALIYSVKIRLNWLSLLFYERIIWTVQDIVSGWMVLQLSIGLFWKTKFLITFAKPMCTSLLCIYSWLLEHDSPLC